MTTDIDLRGRQRARRTLILVALLFIAPVGISFWLYYGGTWRPEGETHYGTLISPPRRLPEVSLPQPGGEATSPDFLHHQWSLIYVGAGTCDKRCRQALYEMRQVRLSLNRDMDRVQRVFLYAGDCCEQPYFSTEQAGLVTADIDGPQGLELLHAIAPGDTEGALSAGRIYVVDPLGNAMLSYHPGAPPKGMIADLKRLLKLSHIG